MRFCNHCGQLYTGERCKCRKNVKREYRKENCSFYDSKAWRKTSYNIRIRDYNMDRLQLYFYNHKPQGRIEKLLYDFLIDAYGEMRELNGKIQVHHIEELELNWKDRFNEDNLISLDFNTHEYIHQLYFSCKEEVQAVLKKVVQSDIF